MDVEEVRPAAGGSRSGSASTESHQTNTARDESNYSQFSQSEELVDVTVGTGDDCKVFQIPKNSVCKCSEYFKDACLLASNHPLVMEDHELLVFDLFFKYIQEPAEPICYTPENYSEETWTDNAAAAWVFARKLRAPEFEKYAFSQFIQNCAIAAFGPWEYLQREAPPRSPIRLFSDHWVAWNCSLAGGGPNEFSDLQAAALTSFVTENTRDPRIYDIEHWYSSCGSLLEPNCLHDPNIRQQNADEADGNEPTPEPEWGRSYETMEALNATPTIPAPIVHHMRSLAIIPPTSLPPRGNHRSRRDRPRSLERTPTPTIPLASLHPRRNHMDRDRSESRNRPPRPSRHSSPAPSLTSVRSPTVHNTPRDYNNIWKIAVYVVFAIQIILIVSLSTDILYNPYNPIRTSTKNYSMFVAVVGVLTLVIPPLGPAYAFFGVAGGIATIVDYQSCQFVTDDHWPLHGCVEVAALLVFVWLSLPVAVLYALIFYRAIRGLSRSTFISRAYRVIWPQTE